MDQATLLDMALTDLDRCYGRLLQVLSDSEAEPEQIMGLVDEAAGIIAGWPPLPETADQSEYRLRLENLAAHLQQVMTIAASEKGKLYQAVQELKTGKQAIRSYLQPAVGLGYSEGKFVDRKK